MAGIALDSAIELSGLFTASLLKKFSRSEFFMLTYQIENCN